jgi:hypothetical protein
MNIDLTCDKYSFKGKGCVGIIVKNNLPVEKIEILSNEVEINGETYKLSSNIKYGINCINENSTKLSVDVDGTIDTEDFILEKCNSKSSLSIHGIEVPCNLFSDYTNRQSKTVLNIPFPFSFRLDIGQNSDLNLNSARNQIIYDEKWLLFEENLYRTICDQLVSMLNKSDWETLKQIILKNYVGTFSRIVHNN